MFLECGRLIHTRGGVWHWARRLVQGGPLTAAVAASPLTEAEFVSAASLPETMQSQTNVEEECCPHGLACTESCCATTAPRNRSDYRSLLTARAAVCRLTILFSRREKLRDGAARNTQCADDSRKVSRILPQKHRTGMRDIRSSNRSRLGNPRMNPERRLVDGRRIELPTSALRTRRSPS